MPQPLCDRPEKLRDLRQAEYYYVKDIKRKKTPIPGEKTFLKCPLFQAPDLIQSSNSKAVATGRC